jgi:uncharacterized protein YdaU (DUF1376 family)
MPSGTGARARVVDAVGRPPMNRAPAFQWYPRDYESDEEVKLMTYEAEGVYRRLLDHQWLHGGIPSDVGTLARLVPKVSGARFRKLWPSMAMKFVPIGVGRLANARLERGRTEQGTLQNDKSAAGLRSAEVRRERFGTAQPRNKDSNGVRTDTEQPVRAPVRQPARTGPEPSSSSALKESTPSSPPERLVEQALERALDERAGRFLERYPEIYAKVRLGAHYHVKETRDLPVAKSIVAGWPDDTRLDVMVELFLKMNVREANNIPGTPGQFLNMAPECDARLREHGR